MEKPSSGCLEEETLKSDVLGDQNSSWVRNGEGQSDAGGVTLKIDVSPLLGLTVNSPPAIRQSLLSFTKTSPSFRAGHAGGYEWPQQLDQTCIKQVQETS
jgi:hypothetical protein